MQSAKQLHSYVLKLYFAGVMTDSQKESIKNKILKKHTKESKLPISVIKSIIRHNKKR